jgi:hypothetical protein
LSRQIFERTIALVSEETIVPVISDQQVRITVIVDVTHTNALSPAGLPEPRLFGDLDKMTRAVILVKKE